MKTYEDIDHFSVTAATIDDHYTPISVNEYGEEVVVNWCAVDGMSFYVPWRQEPISIDSESHSTSVEIEHGRIRFDSYKPGVDEEHFLSSFEDDKEEALKVDFEQFHTFDLDELHIVADCTGQEDIHPDLLMITSLEIYFNDNTFVAATNEQLIELHMSVQRDYIARQLRFEQMKFSSKESA